MPYTPPFTLTANHIDLVSRVSEALGSWKERVGKRQSPTLRLQNRIRTIQASLAIEQNSLTVDQVSDVLEGKRVIGPQREIQEVKNAIRAYEELPNWEPHSPSDFLRAHGLLMETLADDAGAFRASGVGIYREEELVHMAPPADKVPHQIRDLFGWLETTDLHPLLASAVTHYEIEFIHPFSDGNGRMGRLWQTLILSQWEPQLAWLPVETVIHDRQRDYYEALAASDQAVDAGAFVNFALESILQALQTDQESDQVTDQVKLLLSVLKKSGKPLSTAQLMKRLKLRHRPTFRRNYLQPALKANLIAMTDPDSPSSPKQKYKLK